MPGYDRSGPEKLGQMTGRGMGYCGGYPPVYAGRRRFGRSGMAFRRRWRHSTPPTWDWEMDEQPQNEKDWLQEEEKFLEAQLKNIRRRIKAFDEPSEE